MTTMHLSPSVRRLLAEKDIDPASIKGTGKGGRITKEDVEKAYLKAPAAPAAKASCSLLLHQRRHH